MSRGGSLTNDLHHESSCGGNGNGLITTTMAIPPMSGEMAVMLMIKLQWTPKMRTTMADGADAEWQRKCLVNA